MANIKERPILMSGEMVRAILDGKKTQTRRPIKPQPTDSGLQFIVEYYGEPGDLDDAFYCWQDSGLNLDEHSEAGGPCQRLCPYGRPGDRLWVRETWCECYQYGGNELSFGYRADGQTRYQENMAVAPSSVPVTTRWKPSIHMPRRASRILLEITEVRVEQVQKISRADAKSEGFLPSQGDGLEHFGRAKYGNAEKAFRACWDFHTANGFDWNSNPWVWIISFRRLEEEG